MAKFAPVCPPQILKAFKERGVLGDYHLLLAHDIAAKQDQYLEIFERPDYSSMTIILDNSVIELGGAVNLDIMQTAAQIVKPMTTVLPDVLLDTAATVESCGAALNIWDQAWRDIGHKPAFMYVPQGRTLKDWVCCAEYFADDQRINFWGIPRNVVGTEIGSRRGLASILRGINPSRQIHMLGMSDNVVDDIQASHERGVFGIDSAVPIRAISHGLNTSMETLNKMPPRGNWWEEATFDQGMIDALQKARGWFHG